MGTPWHTIPRPFRKTIRLSREERDLVDAVRGTAGFSEFARPAVLAAARFSTPHSRPGGVPTTPGASGVVIPMLTDKDRVDLRRCASGMSGAGGLLNQLVREMNIRRGNDETPPLDVSTLTELMGTLRGLAEDARDLLDHARARRGREGSQAIARHSGQGVAHRSGREQLREGSRDQLERLTVAAERSESSRETVR